MLKSNGEDHGKPLQQGTGSPTLGRFGQPNVFLQPSPVEPQGELAVQIATFTEHYVGIAEHGIAERQKEFEVQVMEKLAHMERVQEEAFRRMPEETRSAFAPDRLTGPVQFIRKLAELWDLNTADLTAVLGFERDEERIVEGLLAGRTSLRGRDQKDRITALFRIRSLLSGLLRNPDAERTWLRTARKEFEGKSPLDLLREGSMEGLLMLRQYVEHLSGL